MKPRSAGEFKRWAIKMNALIELILSALLRAQRIHCGIIGLFFVCAANAAVYVGPADGLTAEIVLEHDVVAPMDFIIYAQAETCRGRSYVQRPTDQRRIAKVRANLPIAFSIGHSIGMKDIPCEFTFRFTPEENGRYVFFYKKVHEGGLVYGGTANCTLQVVRIQADGIEVPQPIDRLSPKVPFFESGAWCEDKK